MINKDNYHLSTKGTFNVVSTNKLKRLWRALLKQGFKLETASKGDIYIFENKQYEFSFYSEGRYGSLSIYFIINDKQLLRLSDHWSKGSKKIITKTCGFISSCYWELQGNSFPFYLSVGSEVLVSRMDWSYYGNPYWYKDWKKIDNCLLAGIINLSELKN